MKRTKQSTFAKRERQEQGAGFAPVGGAQFTPGPWSTERDRAKSISIYGGSTFIGEVYNEVDEPSLEEQANTNLIAAAPAMYTLLQDATLQLARLTGNNLETYARTFSVLAKKALAQAEGRER